MDSTSSTLPASLSPWSTHTLQIATSEERYQAGDDKSVGERLKHIAGLLPRPVHSSSVVLSTSGDIYIFGGVGNQFRNDTWVIKLSGDSDLPFEAKGNPTRPKVSARLVKTNGNVPEPRYGYQSALARGLLIVWGGRSRDKGRGVSANDNSLYFLDISTHHWTKIDIQPAPSARVMHAACICGDQFIVFGGLSDTRYLNDLWSLDIKSLIQGTPKWERIKIAPGSRSPSQRLGQTMVAYGGKLHMFGGYNGAKTWNDTWCFDMNTRTWTELRCIGPIPLPRAEHAVALGRGKEQRWYRFPSMDSGPPRKHGHTLATAQEDVFLFGGLGIGMSRLEEETVYKLDMKLIGYPEQGEEITIRTIPHIEQPGSTRLIGAPKESNHLEDRLSRSSGRIVQDIFSESGTFQTPSIEAETDTGESELVAVGYVKANSRINYAKPNTPCRLTLSPKWCMHCLKAMEHLRMDKLVVFSEEHPFAEKGVVPPATCDTITGAMSATEILRYLVLHGCRNISNELDISHVTKFPVSSGGFGDVYCATLRNGDRVGLKCIRTVVCSTSDGKFLKHAAHELYVWSKCNHFNILELFGVMVFRDRIAMVSPWVENGHLRQFLSRDPQVDRCTLCAQIADGVGYLHEQGIVHGDLKPENVLISQDYTPKLTDFGNAALSEYTLRFTNSSTTQSVSVRWTAPEILKQETKTTQAGDIFAFGMIIFEAITGLLPYVGVSEPVAMFSIVAGKLPERPQAHIPSGVEQADRLWSVITSCWAYDPSGRPKAQDIRSMIDGITFGGLLSKWPCESP
ncbi:unnamed protein product [Rhizoctonia solani]|uniref:Protein kinase domain-containing protein n=1 Tax=Rhizoctonia solani TaxID=456999 RepID=A0A8H3B0R4_9AGAM|nr:unnamed protein product [Rhizoctonia solani]